MGHAASVGAHAPVAEWRTSVARAARHAKRAPAASVGLGLLAAAATAGVAVALTASRVRKTGRVLLHGYKHSKGQKGGALGASKARP